MKSKNNITQILKHTIVITLPLVVVLFLGLSAIASFQDKTKMHLIKGDVKNRMSILQEFVSKDFEFVTSDLEILSESKILHEFIINYNKTNYEKLVEFFISFSKRKKLYDQIRFIDKNGMEKVRINFNSGNPEIVESKYLKNKKNRYYFKDVFELGKGEIFVSPMDLNIEHGEIEIPLKPMIRFGTPIFNEKEKSGIVLLNYFGKNIIDDITKHSRDFDGETILLNSTGHWFLSPNKDDEWGFMYDDKNERIFKKKYPEEWDTLNIKKHGQFSNSKGLFTFETIYPIREVWKSSSGSGFPYEQSDYLIEGSKYYWKLLLFYPMEKLNAKFLSHRYNSRILLFFLTSIIFLLAFFLSRTRLKKIIAEKEKEKALQILKISEQKLIEENSAKDKFFSIISHDLKSPFQGLMGFSNLLTTNHTEFTEDEVDEALQSLNNSILHIYDLLEGLLDWSRIQTGRFKCNPIKLNIFSLTEGIRNLLLLSAERKSISILNDIDKDLIFNIDKKLLETVLRNLVANAIKFTQNGGTIKVYNKIQNSQNILFVEDNGIGINEENLIKLFKLDIHHTTKGTENEQGTGLGLILCKDLLEKANGKIWVESEVGVGSKFIITFPLDQTNV